MDCQDKLTVRGCHSLPLNLTLLGSCGCAEDVCFLVVPADGAPMTVAPGLSTLSTMIAGWVRWKQRCCDYEDGEMSMDRERERSRSRPAT